MDIPTMVALLTLLGSCCLGLTLLAILIVVVALLLSGRLKSAKVTGLGAGVELTAADKPPAARPTEPPAATPAPPPSSPAEPAPAPPTPTNVVVGSGSIDASTHDRHDVHIQAGGDVAHGDQARVSKPTPDRRK